MAFQTGDNNIAKRPEVRKKISESKKGKPGGMLGKHQSKKTRKRISEARKGMKFSIKHIVNLKKSHMGIKQSERTRRKISEANKGENSYSWQGGINPVNDTIRKSIEFRLWREAVFARDNYTCQKCQQRGGKLHSHHILNFAQYPELRFAIDNGITFCRNCHRDFHKKYGIKNNTKGQIEEFLNNK